VGLDGSGRECCEDASCAAIEIAGPDDEHSPSEGPKGALRLPVAASISLEFGSPVFFVC
jgi:hypothetical protein